MEYSTDPLFIDAVSPLFTSLPKTAKQYLAGGVHAIGATIPPFHGGSFVQGVEGATKLRQTLEANNELLFVENIDDFRKAQESKRLGVYLHAQSLQFIEDDIDHLYTLRLLGVRVAQIAYNRGNMLGAGCHEENDAGLTRLGRRAVARMNELGIVVDLSHCGMRTSLEAIELSQKPSIFSHSACKAVYEHTRNITDAQIRAVAAKGGVVGIPALSYFVGPQPVTVGDVVRHVIHVATLVGVEHVALGPDYFTGVFPYESAEEQSKNDREAIDSGMWDEDDFFPAPTTMPKGIETPAQLGVLKLELGKHFSPDELAMVLGGNWLRVFTACW